MSKRFIYFYVLILLVSSLYFLVGIEPNLLNSNLERALAIFLFQSDYLLLFAYCTTKTLGSFDKNRPYISSIYFLLISVGLLSLILKDEYQYDKVYALIQIFIRFVLLLFVWNMASKKTLVFDYKRILFFAFIIFIGSFHLYLINLYPRESMLNFNLNSIFSTLIFALFFLIHLPKDINVKLFYIGLLAIGISDYYFILPAQLREFEITFFILRIVNSIGELIICYTLL